MGAVLDIRCILAVFRYVAAVVHRPLPRNALAFRSILLLKFLTFSATMSDLSQVRFNNRTHRFTQSEIEYLVQAKGHSNFVVRMGEDDAYFFVEFDNLTAASALRADLNGVSAQI